MKLFNLLLGVFLITIAAALIVITLISLGNWWATILNEDYGCKFTKVDGIIQLVLYACVFVFGFVVGAKSDKQL